MTLKPLLRQALDDALMEQVKQLFLIWLKDSTDQPQRARGGIEKAVAAWRHACRAIEQMEDDP
jgi:hypothetical protein